MAFTSGIGNNNSVNLTMSLSSDKTNLDQSSDKISNIATGALESKASDPTSDFLSKQFKIGLEPQPLISDIQGKWQDVSPVEPFSTQLVNQDENIHLKVNNEAKRQGYTYNNELMVYINEEGDGKTWNDFYGDIQKSSLPSNEISCKSQKNSRKNNRYEKEKIDLLTRHLLNVDVWLEGLVDAGWQISPEGGFAIDLRGCILPYDDLIGQFNKEFLSYLELKGFAYDIKSEIIYKNQIFATFDQVTELVKGYLETDVTSQAYTIKKNILNLFSECLFSQDQEQFHAYIKSQGFSFDVKTQELRRGNLTATLWQAEGLKSGFLNAIYPNLKEVKFGLRPLMNYVEFIKILENKGYHFTADEGAILYKRWVGQRDQTILNIENSGFKYDVKVDLYAKDGKLFTLDQIYDMTKSTLLKQVVVSANEQLGMKYNLTGKYFKNDLRKLSTIDVLYEIMIQDFGL